MLVVAASLPALQICKQETPSMLCRRFANPLASGRTPPGKFIVKLRPWSRNRMKDGRVIVPALRSRFGCTLWMAPCKCWQMQP